MKNTPCCFKLKVALFYRGYAPETERHQGPLENARGTFTYSKLGIQTQQMSSIIQNISERTAMKEFNCF